jgi:hypothetical protein
VGEGPEKKNILNKIESMGLTGRVILVGFKQNPMPLIMNSCLFVLSSNNEGFGLVLIEALALKKQIVSTDCPSGPREILMDGKFGQLVPVNDSKKLAISIQKSIEGQINFNENSLLKRAKYFNLERFYKSFLLMIENI